MKTTKKWIIENWMGKHVYQDKVFNSFEEARSFISDVANEEVYKSGLREDSQEAEDLHNGICEDLYAIETNN